jgi:hypothetical protein
MTDAALLRVAALLEGASAGRVVTAEELREVEAIEAAARRRRAKGALPWPG